MRTLQALKIIFLKASETVDKQWHHLLQLPYIILIRHRGCSTSINIIWRKRGLERSDIKIIRVLYFYRKKFGVIFVVHYHEEKSYPANA